MLSISLLVLGNSELLVFCTSLIAAVDNGSVFAL